MHSVNGGAHELSTPTCLQISIAIPKYSSESQATVAPVVGVGVAIEVSVVVVYGVFVFIGQADMPSMSGCAHCGCDSSAPRLRELAYKKVVWQTAGRCLGMPETRASADTRTV